MVSVKDTQTGSVRPGNVFLNLYFFHSLLKAISDWLSLPNLSHLHELLVVDVLKCCLLFAIKLHIMLKCDIKN